MNLILRCNWLPERVRWSYLGRVLFLSCLWTETETRKKRTRQISSHLDLTLTYISSLLAENNGHSTVLIYVPRAACSCGTHHPLPLLPLLFLLCYLFSSAALHAIINSLWTLFHRCRSVLSGCPNLTDLNLASCRGVPRGIKRQHLGESLRSLPQRMVDLEQESSESE